MTVIKIEHNFIWRVKQRWGIMGKSCNLRSSEVHELLIESFLPPVVIIIRNCWDYNLYCTLLLAKWERREECFRNSISAMLCSIHPLEMAIINHCWLVIDFATQDLGYQIFDAKFPSSHRLYWGIIDFMLAEMFSS